MSSYRGLHARFYDLIYADKPYADEAAFVAAILREEGIPSGRVVDVACGTGRHAAELVRLGFTVTGVDYNGELLAIAREQVPLASFLLQDMRDLHTGGGFDAVTSLFDSIGYPLTDAGVIAALTSMAAQLRPEGRLLVEFLHAPALRSAASPVRVRRWHPSEDETLVRISDTTVDAETNQMEVCYELLLLDERTQRFERWQETQRNRAFEVDEMRDLLLRAELEPVRFVAAYEADTSIGARVWHVIAIARPLRTA